MSRPPYWCLCCRCSSVGDVAGWRDAAALLVLRRTADAVAAGEHVLNTARRRRVLGNNAAFCSSRCGTDAVISQHHGAKTIYRVYY